MKRKWLVSVLALTLLSASLLGCSPKETPAASETTPEEPAAAGHITVGTTSVPSGIDPAISYNGWGTVRYAVGETLFKLNENLQPQPWLAESYQNIDENTWEITLKDNINFSNGEKMTAEKVIAVLQRVGELHEGSEIFKTAEYKAEGNKVIIKTAEPYAALINDLSDPYASIIDTAAQVDHDLAPVGTGAYMVKEFVKEEKIILSRNENYWDGAPSVETVEYKAIPDVNTIALALQSGEIDVALNLTSEVTASLQSDENIEVLYTPTSRTCKLDFNTERLTDKEVRTAIMMGIDKNLICDQQLEKSMTASSGAFLDSSLYNGKNLSTLSYDPEAAKKLLADAGYADSDSDGILEKDGQPLKVKLATYKRLSQEAIATEIQSQLKRLGIDVEIAISEKASALKEKDYDFCMSSAVTAPTGDPYYFLNVSFSKEGTLNYVGFENEQIASKLKELAMAFDEKSKIALTQEIQQIVIDERASDYIGFNNMIMAHKKSVSGFEASPTDYYQVNSKISVK